jgi:hypothetical protein
MFAKVPEPAYPPEIQPGGKGDSADDQVREVYRVDVVANRRKEARSYEGEARHQKSDPSGKDATDQSTDQQPDPQLVTARWLGRRGLLVNSQEHEPPHGNTIPRCGYESKTGIIALFPFFGRIHSKFLTCAEAHPRSIQPTTTSPSARG